MHHRPAHALAGALAFILAAPGAAAFAAPGAASKPTPATVARASAPGYSLPPQGFIDLVDAPVTPSVSLSPRRDRVLYLEPRPLMSVAELAGPELKLAGLSLNPRNHAPSRLTTFRGVQVQALGAPLQAPAPLLGLPAEPRLAYMRWSPDGQHLAFVHFAARESELWIADLATRRAHRVGRLALNAVAGAPFSWYPDSRRLLAQLVTPQAPALPAAEASTAGPVIQESNGVKAPARTFPDLLKSPEDEARFEHYLSNQLAVVDLAGAVRPLGKPGLQLGAEPSPDGRFVLVKTVHRPYSYMVPLGRFPARHEVWNARGERVRLLADTPLAENVPVAFDAVARGPRAVGWREDAPATVSWREARDGGDPKRASEVRDALLALSAPFTGAPVTLGQFAARISQVRWGHDGLALVTEQWWKTRRERSWALTPGTPARPAQLLIDRSSEDAYADPGTPLMRRDARGRSVLATSRDGRGVYFEGEGASPEGNRPFLDERRLDGGETKRLWRADGPCYEFPLAVLDEAGSRVLTRREAPTEPPNFYLRDLTSRQVTPLTRFPDPAPQLHGIQKELIHYTRADGVPLSGTLYLPAGYTPAQGPLPMLMWAYPQEFKSAAAAGQVKDSPYRFNRIRSLSPLFWLTRGYAVLDDPKLPIIGLGDAEPNDTYVAQLVAGARAAVDEVVRRGVADRRRIAIGGHSYGAFMTANLLAHSELFAAGIARSGAYNRTLTPFGFQSEERTLWEAPGTYEAMSPFNHANRIHAPLLIIHGQADANPGTFPVQSERMFQALKGLGAPARLVLLPHEGHGYVGRESVLHVLYETDRWLEQHVKHRPETSTVKP